MLSFRRWFRGRGATVPEAANSVAERTHPEGAGSGAGAEIRPYQEADLKRIEQIHAKQGFDYPFPDLSDPAFALGSVADDGGAQAALMLKVTAEAYLFLDRDYGTPRQRWATFLQLHEAARRQALDAGLQDVNLWAPPDLPRGFIRKLGRLGWTRNCWQNFSFRLRD